jgi:hypothetical protein
MCENLIWDFDIGQFECTGHENRPIDDLHIIPDWCPLLEVPKAFNTGKRV